MKVFSIQNEKGGCGKSTTALQLGYGLSKKGLRVLVIDNDPQSNITSILLKLNNKVNIKSLQELDIPEKVDVLEALDILHQFVNKDVFDKDISDVLETPALIKEAIRKTSYENLDLLPSSHKLSESDMKLKNAVRNADGRLRSAINLVEQDYDVVIIDNSPFENALTYNSISACYREGDTIIITTKVDQGGLEGLDHTARTMIEWLSYGDLNYDFKILPTMVNRVKTDHAVIDFLRKLFGERVYESCIRYQAKAVVEAGLNKSILIDVSKDPVAEDYKNWVDEVYKTLI